MLLHPEVCHHHHSHLLYRCKSTHTYNHFKQTGMRYVMKHYLVCHCTQSHLNISLKSFMFAQDYEC
jgi:hypothetical protein